AARFSTLGGSPMRRALILFASALAACTGTVAPRHPGAHGNRGTAKTVAGLVAINWKDDVPADELETHKRALGLAAQTGASSTLSARLTVGKEQSFTEALLARLRSDPFVDAVEPVYEYDALFVPNDPDYKRQWHMQQIGAEK